MSGVPTLYFAEDLIKKIKDIAEPVHDRILAGKLSIEDYREQTGQNRAYEQCIALITELLAESQDAPLKEIEQRVTGKRR